MGKFDTKKAQTKSYSHAFALPTVLISSVVMLMVLLMAIQSVVSVSEGIRRQYSDKLAKEATASGLAIAKACMAKNGNTISWSDTYRLKPNTDCTGTEAVSCPVSSTDTRCYVLIQGLYRTAYSVGVTYDGSNNPIGINVKGIVREVRKTSGELVSQSTSSLKMTTSMYLY